MATRVKASRIDSLQEESQEREFWVGVLGSGGGLERLYPFFCGTGVWLFFGRSYLGSSSIEPPRYRKL
jgi:hypothetical protein